MQAPQRDPAPELRPTSGRVASAVQYALGLPMINFYLVLVSAALLVGIGMMMVLSASSVTAGGLTSDPYYYLKRQLLFLALGIPGAIALTRVSPKSLRVLGWVGIFFAYILVMLTFTPLGIAEGSNRNWIRLSGSLSLQPSEFAKLAIVVWGADVLARKQKLLAQPAQLIIPYIPVTGLLIILVILQRDLGTALVMCAMVIAILFVLGVPLRVFLALFAAAAAGVALLAWSSADRMRRIMAFLDPQSDPLGANMQSNSGLYAIASGGWWGQGLGASRQKWGLLSAPHTDFIFAVIGEELGLFGSLAVLALILVFGFAGFRIASRARDNFSRYAAAGVTSWIVLQSLINIAVVLRLVPVLGVPLPLVSYGGSALLANLLAVGVLLSCARNEPLAVRYRKRQRQGQQAPQLVAAVAGSAGRIRDVRARR